MIYEMSMHCGSNNGVIVSTRLDCLTLKRCILWAIYYFYNRRETCLYCDL